MILVTGGAGYIGSHAVKLLLEKGEKVAVLDNLGRGYKQVIEVLQNKYGRDKLEFYKADLTIKEEVEKVFDQIKPEGVMHFAAFCLVNESIEKPEIYFGNNAFGSLNLLETMKKYEIKNLVFSSTCAVYGESKYLPMDEKHPLSPINPYGESKLMVEKIIGWFEKVYGLRSIIFRYFNVSGASDDGMIGDSKKPSQLLIQNVVRGALEIELFKLTCPKVETADGTPIRDYVDIGDLVRAHAAAMDYLRSGGGSEVINLGTGKGSSVLEIVEMVKKITGKSFLIELGEARKGEWAEVYADISKAKRILGWEPKRTIKDSVETLVKWYTNHPQGWEY